MPDLIRDQESSRTQKRKINTNSGYRIKSGMTYHYNNLTLNKCTETCIQGKEAALFASRISRKKSVRCFSQYDHSSIFTRNGTLKQEKVMIG